MSAVRSFSEKRWVALDEGGPQGAVVISAVSEVKPIVADPNAATPQLFLFQGPQGGPVTRPQLELIGELVKAALTDAPESKIALVPPGTRLR